mmetsp:Transcript_2516/g.6699  ORF Transcript_2516/g.6699 Transcript_2516/m.6699 type:complete len:201 (-) Transcript_2516:585-1187(-)
MQRRAQRVRERKVHDARREACSAHRAVQRGIAGRQQQRRCFGGRDAVRADRRLRRRRVLHGDRPRRKAQHLGQRVQVGHTLLDVRLTAVQRVAPRRLDRHRLPRQQQAKLLQLVGQREDARVAGRPRHHLLDRRPQLRWVYATVIQLALLVHQRRFVVLIARLEKLAEHFALGHVRPPAGLAFGRRLWGRHSRHRLWLRE